MKPHIVALGRHAVDVARRDSHQPRQVRRPEFVEKTRFRRRRRIPDPRRKIASRPRQRTIEPLGLDRLHHIVDRRHFERCHRKLVERGHEYHRRAWPPLRQGARHLDPVEPGHGNIEQQQVGMKGLGHPHRSVAVAGGPDQVDPLAIGEQQLQSLGGERLVVGDQQPQ